jgi:predicted nucleic acid-binding protein
VIAYLDSSALVKRYVGEPGSREAAGLIEQAALAGTAVMTLVEVAAALFWSEMLGEPVALATWDRRLWKAARESGPEAIPRKQP